MQKIFLDTNIIADIFDETRPFHIESSMALNYCYSKGLELFTSCDIITTLYYIYSKKSKSLALQKIETINRVLSVIEFSNAEVEQTCVLMNQDNHFHDLEDTIQYVLAQKMKCDIIITNDKKFHSPEVALHTSKSFLEAQ